MPKGPLVLDKHEEADYTLQPGATTWITVGDKSVFISPRVVEVYAQGCENSDPIAYIRLDN